ncbi:MULTISPECIES: DUF4350 domain-containing protein [unclassified Microbacterium]|uniref:DUF4350 domain-containing protein n=1 Tax=unclassified Microbacterium TaxID=2609290 RepID=UPI00214D03AD|nr:MULTISPECIES: DUF4350 domain-containing protein [unclassified Microbacterium]MCR2785245.1 DUF4350 domain-containing protein [Microbacterium sp. zg.B96]WIM16775.1 DUF4350 domain-containing protein [Microbacterium sp. zg-B96]
MTAPAPVDPATRRRRTGGWVGIAAAFVLIGVGSAALLSLADWNPRDVLDPASAGPTGTRALVEVMRAQGLTVEVARDLDAAERAVMAGPATLVITDTAPLDDATLERVAQLADDVVLLDPHTRDVRVLFADSRAAGFGDDALTVPECGLPDAERAGPIVPGAVFTGADGITSCYPSGDGHALLVHGRDEGRLAALDARELFTNAHLADNGNAALAANLLGRLPRVVWYLPALGDGVLPDTMPTLGELTPDWVTPALALLGVSAVAAMVWRGRRFGPLVTEDLPVIVRAAETTEGRARLYARSRDTVHVADQLRHGALDRLTRTLGLGPSAAAHEIADVAAARLHTDRARVRGILLEDLPATDAELVALADALQQLETAVRLAVRPGRNPQ